MRKKECGGRLEEGREGEMCGERRVRTGWLAPAIERERKREKRGAFHTTNVWDQVMVRTKC